MEKKSFQGICAACFLISSSLNRFAWLIVSCNYYKQAALPFTHDICACANKSVSIRQHSQYATKHSIMHPCLLGPLRMRLWYRQNPVNCGKYKDETHQRTLTHERTQSLRVFCTRVRRQTDKLHAGNILRWCWQYFSPFSTFLHVLP